MCDKRECTTNSQFLVSRVHVTTSYPLSTCCPRPPSVVPTCRFANRGTRLPQTTERIEKRSSFRPERFQNDPTADQETYKPDCHKLPRESKKKVFIWAGKVPKRPDRPNVFIEFGRHDGIVGLGGRPHFDQYIGVKGLFDLKDIRCHTHRFNSLLDCLPRSGQRRTSHHRGDWKSIVVMKRTKNRLSDICLLYTSPGPRD